MTRNVLALTMAAAFCSAAVSVAAQTGSGTAKATTAPATMRVTGCIERADQLIGNGSTLGTTVDSLDLVLMKAMPASDGSSTAKSGGTRPTGTNGESNAIGKMYRLSSDAVKMNSHVGHQVEIAGSLQTAGPGTSAAAPSAATADNTNPSAANAPLLKVESLKMLSNTCPK
jgi:hypothetical protein